MPAMEMSPVSVKPSAPPELLCHPVPCRCPGGEAARCGDPAVGGWEEKPPAPVEPKQRRRKAQLRG